MAEQPDVQQAVGQVQEEDEVASNYKPPAEKSVKEILQTDAEDESLRKYKESLGLKADTIIHDPNNPGKVIMQKLVLHVLAKEGKEGKTDERDLILDLTESKEEIKKKPFIIKEGCRYKIEMKFLVQREIVAGLKYVQKTYRKGVRVDTHDIMLGSYAPNNDESKFTTPAEDAPSGMLSRGSYTVKSTFIDDDKTEHAKWEWQLEIKKEWQ